MAHAVEQQMQKLLEETQLDMNEFDSLLQPIIDTCTKDAISVRAAPVAGPGAVGLRGGLWPHSPEPACHRLGRTGCSAMPSPHRTVS